MSKDKTYSLSELALSIQSQLNKIYSGAYWISAEILKLNHYTQSGHCYPQLVEKKDGKVVADLKGFILSSRYKYLNDKFLLVTQKELSDGMQIRFRCKIGFHPVYGLSLNILDIDPTYTLGEMTRLRNEAIATLKSENIFDSNRKTYLPLLIKKIAIISVETSKGYGDFKKILGSNKYNKLIYQELFPALVQGDAAVESISSVLKLIKIRNDEFDAVAIIRGGGGETGLDCYDNYTLSREICQFPIPVLTGIGHSSNLTVVEQVAYKSLTTPSELASFIIDGFEEFEGKIRSSVQRLNFIRRTIIERNKSYLLNIEEGIEKFAIRLIRNQQNILSSTGSKIAYVSSRNLEEKKYDLTKRLVPTLNQLGRKSTAGYYKTLDDLTLKMSRNTIEFMSTLNDHLLHSAEKVRILDPVQTLKRGYSITYFKGAPLKKAGSAKKGDEISTLLSEGEIKSKII